MTDWLSYFKNDKFELLRSLCDERPIAIQDSYIKVFRRNYYKCVINKVQL